MSYVIRIQWTFWYHRMMDLWLQQGSGRWARDLFRSEWRYTRSPTSMKGLGRLLCKGTLERSLFGWLDRCCSCWRAIKWSSARGNGWFENWSRCVHISREDRPGEWIQKFKAEVATGRVSREMAPPKGSWRRSSNSQLLDCSLSYRVLVGIFGLAKLNYNSMLL